MIVKPFFDIINGIKSAKNQGCHAPLKLKIEMGVAGTNFELRPPDFGKILIFSKCSNDSKTMF